MEPPVDPAGVPAGTLPRERLVRWCTKALRRKRANFRRRVAARVRSLFPQEHLCETDFVAAVEAAYKEQRFVSASVDAFDQLNQHVHGVLVSIWAGLLALAGIFLVDWGVDFDSWVVPLSGTMLSVALVSGRVPYEIFSGMLFILLIRPFDIGDRILVCDPGDTGKAAEDVTVKEVGLLSTRLVSWQGEEHVAQNFVLHKSTVINLTRSRPPAEGMTVQVPASTPHPQLRALMDAIVKFVNDNPGDWQPVPSADLKCPDYASGVVEVTVFLASTHARTEDGLIDAARNRLAMFVNVYMASTGLDAEMPAAAVRAAVRWAGDAGKGDPAPPLLDSSVVHVKPRQ